MARLATNIRRGTLAAVGAVAALPATAEAIPVEESGAPVRSTPTVPDDAAIAEEARQIPPASNPEPPAPDPPPAPANPTIAVDEPESDGRAPAAEVQAPPAPEAKPDPEPSPRPAALQDPGPTELRPQPTRPGRSDFDGPTKPADSGPPDPADSGPPEPARTGPPEPSRPGPAPGEHEPNRQLGPTSDGWKGPRTPDALEGWAAQRNDRQADRTPRAESGATNTAPEPARTSPEPASTPVTGDTEPPPNTHAGSGDESSPWEELYAMPEQPRAPKPRSRDTQRDMRYESESEQPEQDPSTARAPEEPTTTTGTDALGVLLVKPMSLDAGAVDDPVLRDRLCRVEAVGQCDPERANERLERDRARGLFLPPNYERQSSPYFLEEEREQAEREAERASAESDRGFEVPNWVKETGGAIKGLGESAYRLSPANRRIDPESWQRENEAVGRGFVESAEGMKDSAVQLYRLSSYNRRRDPEDWARATADLGRTAEYAYHNPWEFTRGAAAGMVNWEDLSEGRYGEWLGGLGPDAILTAATWGTGSAVTGSLRGVRAGTGAIRDTPDPSGELPARRSPNPRSVDPVDRALEALEPEARARIDASPESRAAIASMLRDSSAGTRGRTRDTPREGQFEPSRTRGHVSELRVLFDYSRRPDVKLVTPIPGAPGGRSPDFVVEHTSGERTRVEVRTVTGAGRNYHQRGIGRAAAPSPTDIKRAIRAKLRGPATQFNSPLDDVPEGGILSLHLRGPADEGGAAGEVAIPALRAQLRKAKVNVVELNLTDKTVVRYTVDRDGTIARRLVAAR